MEPLVDGTSISEVKDEKENLDIEEEKQDSNRKKPNQSWKSKFQKRTQKSVQKLKKGINVSASKIKKGSKMGFQKLQEEFWIGVAVFKKGAQIGIEKLRKASIIGSQMAQKNIKNTKENMKRLRLRANERAKAIKMRLLALKAKLELKKTKTKEDLKKINNKIKGNAKIVGKRVKLEYTKTVKDLRVLNNKLEIKRVNFCVWFMYNCHTMKLMCLECWMIENPQIIMKNIKKCESSCTSLIPSGYGAIIHKSLILTPFQYINDSKKALQGEVLIQFGDQKAHSPAASCIASTVEIERRLTHSIIERQTNLLSKHISIKIQSQNGSKVGSKAISPTNSKQGSRIGSPTSSKQCSTIGSRSVSKTASRAGTPPSTPKRQHTHKLLPSR